METCRYKTLVRINVYSDIKWLEAGVNLKVDLQGIGGGEVEGTMVGTASIDIAFKHDSINNADVEIDFKGLKVKVWLKAKAEIRGRVNLGPPPELDTEPDYIRDVIKGMKKLWKVNII